MKKNQVEWGWSWTEEHSRCQAKDCEIKEMANIEQLHGRVAP